MDFSLKSVYTMTLHDALIIDPTLLDSIDFTTIDDTLEDESYSAELRNMVIAKFDLYEIAGETLGEQKLFIKRKFEQYGAYWLKLLEAYSEEINWKVSETLSINESGTNNNTRTYTPTVKYKNTTDNEFTDLPRSTASQERPTNKNHNVSTNEVVSGNEITADTGGDTHNNTTTRSRPVDDWKKYLAALRNLMDEFADKFRPCFIQLFS